MNAQKEPTQEELSECSPYPGTCKICNQQVTLWIHRDYPSEKDPFGLIQMAVCNRCGDFVEERERIEHAIKRFAEIILQTDKEDFEITFKLQQKIDKWLNWYAFLFADRRDRIFQPWKNNFAESITHRPWDWPQILKGFLQEAGQEHFLDSASEEPARIQTAALKELRDALAGKTRKRQTEAKGVKTERERILEMSGRPEPIKFDARSVAEIIQNFPNQ